LGLEELLNSLKKNEQKQIDDIWKTAESEAETLRTQVDEAIGEITKFHAEQLASACQKSRREIFSETETKTREKKLFAYQALDVALRKAASLQLPQLRQQNYEKVFADLVAELPERQWEKIVVNPADQELAGNYFTAEIIQPDPAIRGGLLAVTANNRIIVDNTFEKRLERKWPLILPGIIAALEKRYEKPGNTEKTR
jgi:V/A-type H+-transporting ATPase subunit E